MELSFRQDGYVRVKCAAHQEFGDRWVLRSHFIWWKWRRERVKHGWCLHHVDEDRTHDIMSNLRLMTRAAHTRLHRIGVSYGPLSASHRAAIAKALLGKPKSESHKINLRKPKSVVGRAGIAVSNKARVFTPEMLARMSRRGSKHSDATKLLMSKRSKGVPKSAAHRKVISLALKGRVVSEVAKTKLRKTLMLPDVRERRSDAQLLAWKRRKELNAE